MPAEIDKWSTQQDLLINVQQAWQEAKEHLEKAQKYNEDSYNSKYEKLKYTRPQIKEGDLVRLENPVTKVGQKKKIRSDLWKGPYKVIKKNNLGNVQLEVKKDKIWYHQNRIKPAEAERRIYTTRRGRKTNFINYKD